MGGKVWSPIEERHFWRVAISQSAKRGGIDLAKAEKSWDQLAREMQTAMGDNARRRYSGTMLFEHYFQNIESQRRSPNAVIFVREYLAKRDRTRNILTKNNRKSQVSFSNPAKEVRRPTAKNENGPARQCCCCCREETVVDTTTAGHNSTDGSQAEPSSDAALPGILVSIEVEPQPNPTPSSSEDESLFVGTVADDDIDIELGEASQ